MPPIPPPKPLGQEVSGLIVRLMLILYRVLWRGLLLLLQACHPLRQRNKKIQDTSDTLRMQLRAAVLRAGVSRMQVEQRADAPPLTQHFPGPHSERQSSANKLPQACPPGSRQSKFIICSGGKLMMVRFLQSRPESGSERRAVHG